MEIREHIPLAELTTLAIGGSARFFVRVSDEPEAVAALAFAYEKKLPVFILGGGSNLLIGDAGFPGLVIQNAIKGFDFRAVGGQVFLTVGAGESWDEVVRQAVEHDWAGIECMSGVPGTAGGAAIQNAGCYGQSVDKVIKEVRAINSRTRAVRVFSNAECAFDYRGSFFKKNSGNYLVTRVVFMLTPNGAPTLTYHDLKNYFAEHSLRPTLRAVRQALLEIRAKKGAVILPGYECYKTAGSFFKNPIIPADNSAAIKKIVASGPESSDCSDPWFWELPDARVKLSAACLIGKAGFPKGYRRGAVGISPKHPLALINFGGATEKEMSELIADIKHAVHAKFGVTLEEEVMRVP